VKQQLLNKNMNRSIKWAVLGIIIVAAVVALLNQGSGEGEEAIADFPFQSLKEIPDSGVVNQVYVSDAFKMSIKYPDVWKISAYENTEPKHISFSSYNSSDENLTSEQLKKEAIIEFHLLDYDREENIKEWIDEFHSQEPFPTTNSVKASREVAIGGINAIMQLVNTRGEYYYYVFIPRKDRLIFVRGTELSNPHAMKFLEMLKSINFDRE
jgi:hypothetical protein